MASGEWRVASGEWRMQCRNAAGSRPNQDALGGNAEELTKIAAAFGFGQEEQDLPEGDAEAAAAGLAERRRP